MATTFTFTPNTYSGEPLAGYMAQSLLEADSVQRGLWTVVPNVKKKKVLRSVDDEIEFRDPSSDFQAQTNSVTVGERYLEPVAYEIHKEYKFDALRTAWEAQSLQSGSLNDYDGAEVDLEPFLIERAIKKIAIANEKLYHLGKASTPEATFTSAYQGWLPKLKASGSGVQKFSTVSKALTITGITNAGVVTVASTATLRDGNVVTITGADGDQEYGGVTINDQSFTISVLTATTLSLNVALTGTTPATTGQAHSINESNVNSFLSTIYSVIPEALRDAEDLKIKVPTHVANAYRLSQSTSTNQVGAFIGKRELDFLGQVMEPVKYWHGNTIEVSRTSNRFLGVDLLADESMIRTVDMRQTTNEDKVRAKAAMKSDVNFMFGSEIILLYPY